MDQQSFLFQALIFLAAAVCMVPLAKKLGLGSVLGYLLAGVLIGPFVLGFTGMPGQDIMHFAEFGVVMMLFLIGLELDPVVLWQMRRSIAGMGGLQVVLSAACIGGLAILSGMQWQGALALGMTLSLSSTAIVLQTLQEKGLMRTGAGKSGFSVLLFQDIAVIPMLAFFPLLATLPKSSGGHDEHTITHGLSAWMHSIVVLLSVAAIIVSGKYLIRPMFKIVARARVRELFTASALLIVVGIAVLMTQVGLSPALGTFLAGVVLANSEYRHELESDIEPFKGLLLGLFFMAVGASINFNIILEQPLLIAGLVVGVMLVKALVLGTIGKLFRLGTDQNLVFAIGLSQVGEFAFVLLSFSVQEGVLSREITDLLTVVVALSMAITPLLWLLNERWLLPRVGTRAEEERSEAAFEEKNAVIIAGFGHFGNTIGRFLRANGVHATYLDVDSDRVDLLRRMGFKVYYGDASRQDLLKAAGAEEAKLLIVAIDSAEKRLEMIETVKKHFPHLRMLVRSRNRDDAYDLMNAGMLHVYRETIDTALRVGSDALSMLGYRKYTAHRAAQMFFRYDERAMKELAAIKDPDEYLDTIRSNIEELEQLIRKDFMDAKLDADTGWTREEE